MSLGSVNADGRSEQPTTASTRKEIAQLFNHFFASLFSPSTIVIPSDDSMQVTGQVLTDIEITTDEVLKSLKMLNVNKATGSDGNPSRLLRRLTISPLHLQSFSTSAFIMVLWHYSMNGRLRTVTCKGPSLPLYQPSSTWLPTRKVVCHAIAHCA